MESTSSRVSELTGRYLDLWSESSGAPPGDLRRFSAAVKAEKERDVELLLEKSLPRMDRYEELEEGERARYLGRAHTALGKLMTGEGDPAVDRFFTECESAGKMFVRRAKEFDPSLSDDDIHQALRNQWVFNSIQSALAHPVTLTSSSLGYSLMYPCTDNWIDGAGHTAAEKERFNHSLKKWIEGESAAGDESGDGGFRGLLQMIESEYPRETFPAVYGGLLAIQRAQQRSLFLHGPVESRAESFLQSLTIEKGGASVAVDGYLVSGTLGADALHALFGYGVVLQFIDDLQDIREDTASGHSTVFTRACRTGPLDGVTGRLINFSCDTIRSLNGLSSGGGSSLSRLIEGSCMFLILEAVARYSHLYSGAYLRMVEEFSPLRFSYLGGLHDRVRTNLAAREDLLFSA
jgi:hypothetical protein